jgi:hypothetical protein
MKEWLSGYIPSSMANTASEVRILFQHDSKEEAVEAARNSARQDADQRVVLRVVCATAPATATQMFTPNHSVLQGPVD